MYRKIVTNGILFSAVALLFVMPQVAHAQGLSSAILTVLSILNQTVPILVGLATIVFIASLIQYVGSVGDPKKRQEANGRMIFGIVVIAVMLGVWGLVNIVVSVFDLNPYAPPSIEVPPGTGGGVGSGGGTIGSDPGTLVPCGRSGQPLCTACDFYKLADNVIDYIMFLSVPLAVLSIAVGGAYILFGAGFNQSWVGTGKEYIWTAIIGLIIILTAWLVINTVISQLANPGVLQAPWNEVRCDSVSQNIPSSGATVTQNSEPFSDDVLVPQDLDDECVKLSGSGSINMTVIAEGFEDTPYNREFFHRAAANFKDFNFGPFNGKFTIYQSGSLTSNNCENSHVVISVKNESGSVGDGWTRRCAEAQLASAKVTFFKEAFELQGGGCTDITYTLAHELGHAVGALYDEYDDGRNVIEEQYSIFGPRNCIKVDSRKTVEDQRNEACSYFQSLGAGNNCYQGCGGSSNYWRDAQNDLMSYEQTSFGPADTILINRLLNQLVDAL